MKHTKALTTCFQLAVPRRLKQLITFSTFKQPRSIYSIAILVKGDREVGILAAIGAFLTYGIDNVCLVNSATLAGQSYFRNLFCVTPEYKLPATPMNETSHESSVKKEQPKGMFAGAALCVIKPTAIYALLKFKEVRATCSTIFDFAHPKLSMRAFVKWCKGVNISIGLWYSHNFGQLLEVYRDISEPLYVNRGR